MGPGEVSQANDLRMLDQGEGEMVPLISYWLFLTAPSPAPERTNKTTALRWGIRRYNARFKICEHCAERIKAAAKVCRYCGRDVSPQH